MKYCEAFLKYLDAISKKKDGTTELSEGRHLWDERVFSAFRFINTMMLQFHDPISELPMEEKNAIKEFVNFFVGSYGEEEGVWKMITQTWPKRPRIIQMYQAILEEEGMQDARDIWGILTEKEKKQVRFLTDTILNTPGKRILTYFYTDGLYTTIEIDPALTLDGPQETINNVEFLTGRFLYAGGTLFYQRPVQKELTIYAFLACDRTIHSVPADEVEKLFSIKKSKEIEKINYDELPLNDPEERFVLVTSTSPTP